MMFLGYGEDSFTLWVVRDHLTPLLRVLGDFTAPSEAVVFYRPSFGRRGSARKSDGPLKVRGEFGEFDAIVGTRSGIYLIESKWNSSAEAKAAVLALSETQIRRHAIMRCYIDEWRSADTRSWHDFAERSNIQPRLAEMGVSVPGERTRLAKNLRTVLGLLTACSGPVRDILLFMRVDNRFAGSSSWSPPTEVSAATFDLVGVDCRSTAFGGFLPMGASGAEPDMWLSRVTAELRAAALPRA